MHGGLFMQARQSLEYMRYARPRQKLLLTTTLIALGAALIALGHLVGVFPLALGILFIRPTTRILLTAARRSAPPANDHFDRRS